MNQTARGLEALGIVPGDTIAVVLSNRRELLETYGAAIQTGLTFVAVNWHLGETEIAHILEDADAKALIVDAEFADSARAAADRVVAPRVVAVLDRRVCGLPTLCRVARRTLRTCASRSARRPDHVLHVGHDGTAERSTQAVPRHEPRRHRAAHRDRLARADASAAQRCMAGRRGHAGERPVLPRGPDRVGRARVRRGWPAWS